MENRGVFFKLINNLSILLIGSFVLSPLNIIAENSEFESDIVEINFGEQQEELNNKLQRSNQKDLIEKKITELLEESPYSRTTLVQNLVEKEFNSDEVSDAVDKANIDWYEQVDRLTLNLLAIGGYSRLRIVQEVKELGFTLEEAEDGVSVWYDYSYQAKIKAKRLLEVEEISENQLIEKLEKYGFRTDQAEYGTYSALGYYEDNIENAIRFLKKEINNGMVFKYDLIDALEWNYGFSQDVQEAALRSDEINWKQLAVKAGEAMLEYNLSSKRNLIQVLVIDGFTLEEASYAADIIYEKLGGGVIQEGSIEEAMIAVDQAELNSLASYFIFAKKIVTELPKSIEKNRLVERLNIIQDERNEMAIRLVEYYSFENMYYTRKILIKELTEIHGLTNEEAIYGIDFILGRNPIKPGIDQDYSAIPETGQEEPIKPEIESEQEILSEEEDSQTDSESPDKEDTILKVGWLRKDSTWYYYNEENVLETEWEKIGKTWYYLTDNGAMETGWMKVNNTWYHLKENGAMETGWTKVNNTWYYLTGRGAMETGWTKVNNTWYHLKENGAMETGWTKVNNTWYYLTGRGAMETGWTKVNNTWYYLTGSGAMRTGWTKVNNTWYYLTGSGAMRTGWTKVNNTWYYLTGSGAMRTGWVKLGQNWYYLKSSGAMQTGNAKVGGKSYRFDAIGRMR